MRTSDHIKTEIENRFGFFPPFFNPAIDAPDVLENLWQQTLSAYVNNPLPALFKERLFAYLSRYCSVPYCIICHSCALRPLGMTAKDVLELLQESTTAGQTENIEDYLSVLTSETDTLATWPESGSLLENGLFFYSVQLFLTPVSTGRYRREILRLLGPGMYAHLIAFISYVKTCHQWVEAHPELSYEADKRYQDYFNPLIEDEPALEEFFRNYRELVRSEGKRREEQLSAEVNKVKQAEKALELSEKKWHFMLNSSMDGIVALDANNNIGVVSRGAEKMFGYRAEELIGQPLRILIPKDRMEETRNILKEVREKGFVNNHITQRKRKDGSVVDVDLTVTFLGEFGFMGIFRDITARLKAEEDLRKAHDELEVNVANRTSELVKANEALRESGALYRCLVETIPYGVQENDLSGMITYSSPGHARILGYEEDELIGKAIWDFHGTEEKREELRQYLKKLVKEQPSPTHYFSTNMTKDGRLIDFQIDWNYKRDKSGNLTGFISVITDITERKQAETAKEKLQAQLHHSQKMEAIGRLAGGISHDFNNILSAIRNFSSLGMKRFKESTPPAHDIFAHIRIASYRATNLIRQLLTFSNKEQTRLGSLDMNKLINDLLQMLTRIIGEDVSIKEDLDAELWRIMGDSGKMEQVIMNLSVNARDAMPQDGTITIKTENVTIDKECCTEIPHVRPGRFIRLTVKDTGKGISKERLAHIFEPFFTTKKNSSGLGLSVVYGIIEDHKGWINVLSEEGQGATFEVYLPAVDVESEKGNEDTVKVKDLRSSGERILLVEDDAHVRESTIMFLNDEGYVVLDAETAKEALDIFKEEEGRFHVVISDFILPGKNGLQLIEELRSLKPHLKAILFSGYMDRQVDLSKVEEAGISFLRKPFDIECLLRAIKEVMRPV